MKKFIFGLLVVTIFLLIGCSAPVDPSEPTPQPIPEPVSLPEPSPKPIPLTEEIQTEGNLIVSTENNQLLPEALGPLNRAADEVNRKTQKKVIVVSASRTLRRQAELFYDNCLKTPPYNKCKTATCYGAKGLDLPADKIEDTDRETIVKEITDNSKPNNCPHTSNVAVDIWCEGTKGRAADPECMETLTESMIRQGFCRLNNEAWHFEWNEKKVSSGCTQDADATYHDGTDKVDPKKDGCRVWNYTKHECKVAAEPEKQKTDWTLKIQGTGEYEPEFGIGYQYNDEIDFIISEDGTIKESSSTNVDVTVNDQVLQCTGQSTFKIDYSISGDGSNDKVSLKLSESSPSKLSIPINCAFGEGTSEVLAPFEFGNERISLDLVNGATAQKTIKVSGEHNIDFHYTFTIIG